MAAAFSPDGATILTGSDNRTAQLWDAASGRPIGSPMAHRGKVNTVAFSPDGSCILTTSWNEPARLWDCATLTSTGPTLRDGSTIYGLALSPDGKTVATTRNPQKAVQLWDASTGNTLVKPLEHQAHVWTASVWPFVQMGTGC